MKQRLDKLLVLRGLAPTRERSQSLILAGVVLVNEQKIDKPGTLVDENANIRVIGADHPYVSRGGLKLEKALQEFKISVQDKIAIDVGASTGGFTDCLLQHGARKVYAVDVGYGQLAWKLKQDPRVIALERTNIRYVTPDLFKEKMQLAVIDVSFISLTKVLPVILDLLEPTAEIIALVKPQFEVGKGEVGKGGIVKSPEKHRQVLESLRQFAKKLGLEVRGVIPSPIKGTKGNVEFLMFLAR
ncbi:MAG TPA: TlyA family RNA methyltransferase [Candidatus Limnocylindrales bacterium]|nr:TlyA family RNA methyltransferase [Candidatus Limnocylindrales bacterium]